MTDPSAGSVDVPAASADDALLRFFHLVGRLKETPRAGWALRGIADPESVAEHSHRVALLALVLAPRARPALDAARCVAMALVHDLGEALVGDITPFDGIDAAEKQRLESDAMQRLAALAGDEELLGLWREYDGGATAEARFVKELDKLETVLQASEYARDGIAHAALEEFWDAAAARLTSAGTVALLAALRRAREAGG